MFAQFNTYDPVKIRSHPGVRSDLFRRPLHDALVTDFFGGVSQAEVLPPLNAPPRPQSTPDEGFQAPKPDTHEENLTEVLTSVGDVDGQAFLAALGHGPKSEGGEPLIRKTRTWASTLVVFVLAFWAASRRK